MKLLDTIRKDAVCSMKDNTSKLLGLEDVIVKNVHENETGCCIELELPRRKHICPRLSAIIFCFALPQLLT